jgi:hypothetical protein
MSETKHDVMCGKCRECHGHNNIGDIDHLIDKLSNKETMFIVDKSKSKCKKNIFQKFCDLFNCFHR